jgi:hypothetical protein
MITEYSIEYKAKTGHPYGTYICPNCKRKVKSRLSPSYISKIKVCNKCTLVVKKEKYISENKFLNGKTIPKNCKKCDIQLNQNNRARNSKTSKLWNICKDCYSNIRKIYRNKPSSKLKNQLYNLKSREKKWNNYLFRLIKKRYPQTDMSPEYIKQLWEKQNGLCFWFKIPMTITSKHKFPSKPSVDRIDNNKPYTKENCVLCCYSANIGRNTNNVDDWICFLNTIKNQIIKDHKNDPKI